MRVFVTGATGYIGFHVARAFRRAGHEVAGLVRTPEKAGRLAAEEIRPVLGALETPEGWREAFEAASVVVLAAADYRVDALAADRRAIEAMLGMTEDGARPKLMIYTSGVWVHGDTGGAWVDETTPLAPARHVERRPEIEDLVLESEDVQGVVLRPGCVYGRQGGLTGQWFKGAAAGDLSIVGDGANRWAMVHVEDLAAAYVLVGESGASGDVFDLVDASSSTVRELATAAGAAAGYHGAIRAVPVEKAREKLGAYADCLALDQRIDGGKARRLLGWDPRHRGFVGGAETYFASWQAGQAD